MGSRGGTAARTSAAKARQRAASRPRPLTTAEAAWLAAVPSAVATLLAVVALGPALGRLLFSSHPVTFWPSIAEAVSRPEPTEQARFLIALAAPLLLVALTLAGVRRGPRLTPAAISALVRGAQAGGLLFVIVCVVAQRQHAFGEGFAGPEGVLHRAYFSDATIAVALAGAAALLAGARNAGVRARFAAWSRDTRAHRVAAASVAVLAAAIWLLHAVNLEATIGQADYAVAYHIRFTLDEAFAVLNGRSPLVDFVAQYGALWTYVAAGAMALFGTSVGVYTVAMCAISALAMLALYDVLRRVTRSPLAGLLLFLPVLATTFFLEHGELQARYTIATLFGSYPLRFAGVWLLAWLTARHLDGARPRQPWLLFAAGGLILLNNTDHGIPAVGAVLAALLWTAPPPRRALLRRLAFAVPAGLAAAYALVAVLTLLRADALPDPTLLFRYARLFAAAGFAMLPMPALGLHLAIYLTFVAAIGVATVRTIDGDPDRLLTGMLAWVGVFGLGAGSYYVGRSHPEVLITSFGPWALALALLLIVVLRRLAAEPTRSVGIAEAACAAAFMLTVCSLAQTPLPWDQAQRLSQAGDPVLSAPAGQAFVAAHTRRGESVAILMLLGHRIGYNVGVADITPYTGSLSMPTREQLDETLRDLREAGGSKVFLWVRDTPPELPDALVREGFDLRGEDSAGMQLWVRRDAA